MACNYLNEPLAEKNCSYFTFFYFRIKPYEYMYIFEDVFQFNQELYIKMESKKDRKKRISSGHCSANREVSVSY